MFDKIVNYFKKTIWQISLDDLSKGKAYGIRLLRILSLSVQGFTKSQIQQGASSLTYYTLLSLVPMIALLIGLSRGFGLEDALKNWLMERLSEQKEIVNQLMSFAEASISEARQGVITGLGLALLIWSTIKMLSYIEISMNQIWEVKEARPISKQFTDYITMVIVCPIFILISSGLTVYLTARIATLKEHPNLISEIGPILYPLLNIIPFLITCALFTFIYMLMPNTSVRFLPALYAGLIAGTITQILQWAYIRFQIGVASYNAIYGTFAALPLFLVWIHLSWVIFLLGAKVAYALQNVDAYEFVTEDFQLSFQYKKILSLRITHYCIQRFCQDKPALSKNKISHDLSIPLILVSQIINELKEGGILSEVKKQGEEENGFQPAVDVEKLTIKRILDIIDTKGEKIPLPPSHDVETILKSLEEFSRLIEHSDANLPIKNLSVSFPDRR